MAQPKLSPTKVTEINKSLIYFHKHHGPTIDGKKLALLYEYVHNVFIHQIDLDATYTIYVKGDYVLTVQQNKLQAA